VQIQLLPGEDSIGEFHKISIMLLEQFCERSSIVIALIFTKSFLDVLSPIR